MQFSARSTWALWFLLAVSLGGCTSMAARHPSISKPLGSDAPAPGSGRSGTTLLVEPAGGVKPVVRAIDAASHTVFCETYILTQRAIVRALERAAAQGVAVFVLLDRHPFGMASQPSQMASALRSAGVAVRWSSSRFYFTHAKFFVFDDRKAIVSTANFSQSAFSSNRELLVFDRDRSDVHDLSNVFRADWDHIGSGAHNRDLILSPGSRPVLASLLQRARHSIEIYAEEIADPALIRLLIRLHQRLRIQVLVASTYSSPLLSELLQNGVAVRFLKFPYIHAKMFLEDRSIAFIGSENLSPTSLDLNREVGLLVQGRSAARAAEVFSRDWINASIPPVTKIR